MNSIISPPRKRTRPLDISDLTQLVPSEHQIAAFSSPPARQPSSKILNKQPTTEANSRDREEEVTIVQESQLIPEDRYSQDLIEEEDSVIESSLPQYLNHVYGSSTTTVATSRSNSRTLKRDCGSTSPNTGLEDATRNCIIAESQGFSVAPTKTLCSSIHSHTQTNISSTISSNPLPINQPTHYKTFAETGVQQTTISTANTEIYQTTNDLCTKEPTVNADSSPLLFDSPNSQISTSNTSDHRDIETPSHSPSLNNTSLPSEPIVKSSVAGKQTSSNDKFVKRRGRKRKLSATKSPRDKAEYKAPPSCVSLAECVAMNSESLVSLLALVLQVDAVMEVICKKGPLTGSTVPMASILLADPTKSCLKFLLWREASSWVERIVAGDIILLKCIRLKKWREETVGHTIMYSKVLNLHQPQKSLPLKFQSIVPQGSLQCLMNWGKERHGYLFRDSYPLPSSQRPVYFRPSDDLGNEPVVHFRAKLTSIISERVVFLTDQPGKDMLLYLVSSSRVGEAWYRELRGGLDEVWEFLYLSVSLQSTQGNYCLQLTSRSQLRKLNCNSADAQDILQGFSSSSQTPSILSISSISGLLECKVSGVRRCRAKATSFVFQLLDGGMLPLDDLCRQNGPDLVSGLLQAIYVGCASCAKSLTQDENQIYSTCEACKARKPGGHFTSAYCYRPLIVRLTDDSATLDAIANQVVVSKLLGGIEAVELFRLNLTEEESKTESVREAVMKLLSSSDKDCWILNTVFAVDEFSFVESLTISLIDWTPTLCSQ